MYYKHIRSQCEIAIPAWAGSLSKVDSRRIERIQKVAISIIYGNEFCKNRKVLKENSISTLATRRKKLALNFAKKSLKNKRFKGWFVPTDKNETKNNIFKTTKFKNVPQLFIIVKWFIK